MTNKDLRETVITWVFGFVSGLCVIGLIASVQMRPEIVEVDERVMVGHGDTAITAEAYDKFIRKYNERVMRVTQVTQMMRVTAYCPCSKCCGKWADGITASGHKIQSGDHFVAAPKIFPFGTTMIIPGYPLAGQAGEEVEVKDRGGAIKGDCLDVFFPTHQEALNWGVQILDVEIKL